jgi:hypothetical protein
MKKFFLIIIALSIITYKNDMSDNQFLKDCGNSVAKLLEFVHHIISNFLLLAFIYIHLYPNKKFIKLYIYVIFVVTAGWIIFNDRCWIDILIYNICNTSGDIPRFRNIMNLYLGDRNQYRGDTYKIHKFMLLLIYLIYFYKNYNLL